MSISGFSINLASKKDFILQTINDKLILKYGAQTKAIIDKRL